MSALQGQPLAFAHPVVGTTAASPHVARAVPMSRLQLAGLAQAGAARHA